VAWVVENLIDSNYVEYGQVENFNVGTGYEPISVKDVFNMINKIYDGKLSLIEDNKRKRPPEKERELLAIDISKLKKVLKKYKPLKLEEWIEDLVLNPGLRINKDKFSDIYN